jgi:hypothetical protein
LEARNACVVVDVWVARGRRTNGGTRGTAGALGAKLLAGVGRRWFRSASQDLAGSRAGGLYSRTIEVLDQRGIADRLLYQEQVAQIVRFHTTLF